MQRERKKEDSQRQSELINFFICAVQSSDRACVTERLIDSSVNNRDSDTSLSVTEETTNRVPSGCRWQHKSRISTVVFSLEISFLQT